MKIRLYENDNGEWEEWADASDAVAPLMELPDAIVTEFRALQARQAELNAYFTETAKPLIEAAEARRRAEWREAHPEEAKRQDNVQRVWSSALLRQMENDMLGDLFARYDVVSKAFGDTAKYELGRLREAATNRSREMLVMDDIPDEQK